MRYDLNNFLRIVKHITHGDASESSTPRSYPWSSSLRLLCGSVSPCKSLKPPWALRTPVYLSVLPWARKRAGMPHLARTNSPTLCKLLRRSVRSFVAFIFLFILRSWVIQSLISLTIVSFGPYITFFFFFMLAKFNEKSVTRVSLGLLSWPLRPT